MTEHTPETANATCLLEAAEIAPNITGEAMHAKTSRMEKAARTESESATTIRNFEKGKQFLHLLPAIDDSTISLANACKAAVPASAKAIMPAPAECREMG